MKGAETLAILLALRPDLDGAALGPRHGAAEQQKVLIARARMTQPYLIVLDEPCAGMDPGARENFLATLQAVGKHKRIPSLIYVTHHVEEILPLFGKTLILKEGRVLYSGATRAVLKADVLRELYGVSLQIIKRKGRHWPVIE